MAVFLDRDGVLNSLVHNPATGLYESPYDPVDVKIEQDAPIALRRLRAAGYLLCVASNQPAAAKGTTTVASLLAVDAEVKSRLEREGITFDAWQACLHHPEGSVRHLAGPCSCRKPEPGMLLQMAERLDIALENSWMVGDSDVDVAAGAAAGCHTVLIENPGSTHRRSGPAKADACCRDLAGATRLVLAGFSGASTARSSIP